jgi:hypothetical protein
MRGFTKIARACCSIEKLQYSVEHLSDVVGGGKNKQEVTIGDKSGYAKVTLGETDIGKLNIVTCSRVSLPAELICGARIHGEEVSVLATKW